MVEAMVGTVTKVEVQELEHYAEEEEALESPIEGIKKVNKMVLLSDGDCYEALIEEIEIGTLGEFIRNPPQQFMQNWEQRKKKLAYRLKLVIPEYDLESYDIITISAKPNSRMAELAACYGRSIEKGAKVWVCVQGGRLKIKCPPVKSRVERQ